MKDIMRIEGVSCYVDANGTIQINIEDVARGLGFTRVAASGNEVVRWERVNQYLRDFGFMPTNGHDIKMGDFIPENIFYLLAMKANNEAAKNFQLKIANDILPQVRKHGVYMTPQAAEKILFNPDFIIGLAQQVKQAQRERDAALEQVALLQPKADYCDKILQSKEAIPIRIIAKDYGYSATAFNEKLHEIGIIYRCGKTWVVYQKYSNKGYTQTLTKPINNNFSVTYTCWTQKGRLFIYNQLKKCGIMPLCEQENPQDTLF